MGPLHVTDPFAPLCSSVQALLFISSLVFKHQSAKRYLACFPRIFATWKLPKSNYIIYMQFSEDFSCFEEWVAIKISLTLCRVSPVSCLP